MPGQLGQAKIVFVWEGRRGMECGQNHVATVETGKNDAGQHQPTSSYEMDESVTVTVSS
jgi:hypothetical protein